MSDTSDPFKRHSACDECRKSNAAFELPLEVLMLNQRQTETEMFWRRERMCQMYEAEPDMPLFSPEADGPAAKETKSFRGVARKLSAKYSMAQCTDIEREWSEYRQ
jgi:hypothetical protein